MKETPAGEFMTTPVVSVAPDTLLDEVIRIMERHNISGVPVVDGKGKVRGVISESDLLKYTHWVIGHPARDPGKLLDAKEGVVSAGGERGVAMIELVASATAGNVMTDRVITVEEDTPALDIVRIMNKKNINRTPVVDRNGTLKGIVTRADILRLIESRADQG